MKDSCSAIVLAAGFSTRMGTSKALLKFRSGITFIEKVINEFTKSGIEDIVVVVNETVIKEIKDSGIFLPDKIKLALNPDPSTGRFSSLKIGVEKISSKSKFCFMHNVDSPLLCSEVIDLVFSHRYQSEIVVPGVLGKGAHPALLSRSVLQKVAGSPVSTDLKSLFGTFASKKVETGMHALLLNINDSTDYNCFLNSEFSQ